MNCECGEPIRRRGNLNASCNRCLRNKTRKRRENLKNAWAAYTEIEIDALKELHRRIPPVETVQHGTEEAERKTA